MASFCAYPLTIKSECAPFEVTFPCRLKLNKLNSCELRLPSCKNNLRSPWAGANRQKNGLKKRKRNFSGWRNNEILRRSVSNKATSLFASPTTTRSSVLNASLDMLAVYCPDVPRAQARRLQWLVNKVYNDLDDVLQTGREAFLSYLLSVGPESQDKLFASVADKTLENLTLWIGDSDLLKPHFPSN